MSVIVPGLNPSQDEQEAFEARLALARNEEQKVPVYRVKGKPVVWVPQDGSQNYFMECYLQECLYHGTRGPGKTDALLMCFAQHVGKGYGAAWRGIIFRQSYPQLADVQAKSEKWFRQMFPNAKFNRAKMMWEWPTGEVLLLRHMNRPSDYWSYHGHEYPFIGWEELTNWPDDQCYKSMFACCRSSTPGVPKMVRATTNPYGVGHHWVKARFELHSHWWATKTQLRPVDVDGRPEPPRCAIHGHIDENKILLSADPDYKRTVIASASNPAMAKAWLSGSWDIVAGGMFEDVWDPRFNVVGKFDIPSSWRVDRAFDWGSSKPFSTGWYAESDGSDLIMRDGSVMSTVRGDIFRVKEWYGWTGKPNQGLTMLATEIAKGIVEREVLWGWRDTRGSRVRPGPADSSIMNVENGMSIAVDMEKPVRLNGQMYRGVSWLPADKRPGSRKTGWEVCRKMLKAAHRKRGVPREQPGLFVVGEECPQFLRTFVSLPRDEKDMDDVDTDAEDHIGDEVRYKVRGVGNRPSTGRTTGMY